MEDSIMKHSKFVIWGMMILLLVVVGSASAQIGPSVICGLSDLMGTDKDEYEIGETVCFEIRLIATCDINDINLYFWDPCNLDVSEGHCDIASNVFPGGIPLALEEDLKDGEIVDVNCNDFPALAHLVRMDNLTDGDGPIIQGSIGTESTVVGQGQACDTENVQVDIILQEPCIKVSKEVDPNVSKAGDMVTYDICVENCGPTTLHIIEVNDSILGDITEDYIFACDDVLAPGQKCCVEIDYEVQPGDPDPLENIVTVYAIDEFETEVNDSNMASLDLIHPDFEVTKDCLSEEPDPCSSVIFRITVENTGDVELLFTSNEPCLPPFSLPPQGIRMVDVSVWVDPCDPCDIYNEVNVCWTLPPELALDNNDCKDANAVCRVDTGDATRTPGFWQTHCDYTQHVFDVHLGSYIDLGWVEVSDPCQLFAIFLAKNAHNSDGSRRTKLCQAQVTASFHALAAILNWGLDNGAPLPATPAEIAAILGGTDVGAIRDLAGDLGAYNESGDDIAIIDLDGYMIAPADPACSRMLAGQAPDHADCEANTDKPGKGNNGPSQSSSKGKNK
jgi:uncharacterized repeat protein (TIGR01451 family)